MARSTFANPPRSTFDGSRGQSIQQAGPKFRRRVLIIGGFLAIISAVNLAMCTYYSYVSGACSSTTSSPLIEQTACKYMTTDPDTGLVNIEWPACFVQADNDNGKMNSVFATSMAFTGQQTLVYVWLAFAILFRSLLHYEWLASTISFMLYAIIGIGAYYSFNPYLPLPHQTASTVASLTAYIHPNMYDDLEVDEPGRCSNAYKFNLVFLLCQYSSIFVVFLLLIIAVKAEFIRRRYPVVSTLPPLKLTAIPVTISGIVLACYASTVIAKAHASITNVMIVRNSEENSMFPFAQGSVDICTVFLIVSTMSVIRGNSRQSTSAFRLAAATALLHVVLVYPTVFGNLETMRLNKMWPQSSDDSQALHPADPSMNITKTWNAYGDPIAEDSPPLLPSNLYVGFIIGGHGCKHFFYTYYMSFYDDNTNIMSAPPAVVPNDEEAASLCRDTWVGVIAQLCIFGLMHIQIIACSIVYKNNIGRPTDAVYENPGATAPPQGYSEPLLQGAEEVGTAYAVTNGGLPTAAGYKA